MNCLTEPNSIAVVVCATREQWQTMGYTLQTWWFQVRPYVEFYGGVILVSVLVAYALGGPVAWVVNRRADPDN
jgi:hypothetical protein